MKFKTLLRVPGALVISTAPARAQWAIKTVAAPADIGTGKMSMARDSENTLYVAYRDADYNLNVTLYVFPEEEVEEINIEKEWKELGRIEIELSETEGEIERYLQELRRA